MRRRGLAETRSNLRPVQEHLRHSDIQTTTLYTRLTQDELQRVVSVFDRVGSRTNILSPSPRTEFYTANTLAPGI